MAVAPDPRHLDAEARGRAASRLLEAAHGVFAAERRRIERAIWQLTDACELTPERALGLCAQLDAACRLERHLETIVRGGEAASKRLAPARESVPRSEHPESRT